MLKSLKLHEVVRLSVEHGVASKYASFVVVEKRTGARRASGQPEARPIPVSAPAGWAMASAPVPAARGGGWGAPDGFLLHAIDPTARSASAPSFGPPPAAAPAAPRASVARMWDPSQTSHLARSTEKRGLLSAMASRLRAFVGGAAEGPAEGAAGHDAASAEGASDGLFDAELATLVAPRSAAPSPAMVGRAGSLQERFERQLASGLFGSTSDSKLAQVAATVEVLAACHAAGVTCAHSVLGAQVRKAIDALLDALTELGKGDGLEEVARRGLLLACVLAGGARHRKAIARAALASPFESVKALGPALAGAPEAEAELARFGA